MLHQPTVWRTCLFVVLLLGAPVQATELEELAQAQPAPGPPSPSTPPSTPPAPTPPTAPQSPVSPEGRLEEPTSLPRAPEILGDQPPQRFPGRLPTPATGSGNSSGTVVLPGVRGFKVADNGSARPQDRVYVMFNYFDNLNGSLNRQLQSGIGQVQLWRESVGVETTFLGGNASLELRLPLNTLAVGGGGAQGLNSWNTSLGDLGVVWRQVLVSDVPRDQWLTGGLAVTAPTGPSTLGNINVAAPPHGAILQPFAALLWNQGDFYVQGFTAVDIPTVGNLPTFLFNDYALGCFLFRAANTTGLRAVVGAVEAHLTTPLNDRGPLNPDVVNVTAGVHLLWFGGASLSLGVVSPMTGPRPFAVEGIAQLRWRY